MSNPSLSSASSAVAPKPSPWASIARAGAEREAVRLEALRLEAERAALDAQRREKLLRPASYAHRHAIESILGFLSLHELTKAIRVCRLWLSAVQHMRSIGATASLSALPRRSALLRHVVVLSDDWGRAGHNTDADFLDHAVANMPYLHTIRCLVTLPRAAPDWPAKLTDLTLHCAAETAVAARRFRIPVADASAFLQSFRAPLLRRLNLFVDVTELRALALGILTHLPQLSDLTLSLQWSSRGHYRLSEEQVSVIRLLTGLTTLRCPLMHSASMRRLLRPPHEFKLATTPTFASVEARAAECLASLPTLVNLDARLCSSAAFLSNLPLLATLKFDCHRLGIQGGGWLLTADAVVEGLSPCKALTELTLTAPLQSSHMIALLPRLPLLHTLTLEKLRDLESLRCFSVGPITSRLTSLTLRDCQNDELELNELGHLHALRSLQRLEIFDSLIEALTEDDVANYTPPSAFFPHLTHFDSYRSDYTTPFESEDEQDGNACAQQ